MTSLSTVSANGKTTIPRAIREEVGIRDGAKLVWSIEREVITIAVPPEDPIEVAFGMLKERSYRMADFVTER